MTRAKAPCRPPGLLTIEDAETGELLELDSNRAAVRERFAATNAERLAELDRALRRAGVDTLRFSTAEPFAQTLQALLRDPAREEKGMRGRNPKSESEIRRKSEGRRSKCAPIACGASAPPSDFGFRPSFGLGFRPSDFDLSLCAARPRSLTLRRHQLSRTRHPPAAPAAPGDAADLLGATRRGGWSSAPCSCWRWLASASGFCTRPKPPVVVPPEVQARRALEPLRQRAGRRCRAEPGLPNPAPLRRRGLQSAARRTHHHRVLPRHCRPRTVGPRAFRRPSAISCANATSANSRPAPPRAAR